MIFKSAYITQFIQIARLTGKVGHSVSECAVISRFDDKLATQLEQITGIALWQLDGRLTNLVDIPSTAGL